MTAGNGDTFSRRENPRPYGVAGSDAITQGKDGLVGRHHVLDCGKTGLQCLTGMLCAAQDAGAYGIRSGVGLAARIGIAKDVHVTINQPRQQGLARQVEAFHTLLGQVKLLLCAYARKSIVFDQNSGILQWFGAGTVDKPSPR
jgi:hypothetical protein